MLFVCAMVIINIVGAKNSAKQSQSMSFKVIMIHKLCLIPFYIVNFVCWMFGMMVFHLSLVVLPILPFIIAYTYFTMIGTSVHVITNLFILRKKQIITKKQFVVHSILQLLFTVDVFGSVYLATKQKQLENALE